MSWTGLFLWGFSTKILRVKGFSSIHAYESKSPLPSEFKTSSEILVVLHNVARMSWNKTPLPEFASELYRQSDRRFSAKLVPTFADRGCRVVTAADPLRP
jgi:hypothetical protein